MKLIDLLVEELPKRGGWPDGAVCVVQSIVDGEIYFYDRQYDGNGCMPKMKGKILLPISDDVITGFDGLNPVITRAQYESALAASSPRPGSLLQYGSSGDEWDGVGLPPVGCECQIILTAIGGDGDLGECEILFVGNEILVWRQKSTLAEGSGVHRHIKCRPIRSEANNIRKETIDFMDKRFKEVLAAGSTEAMAIFATVYDTIAAGEITGIRIE